LEDRYRILVVRVVERLSTVLVGDEDARLLAAMKGYSQFA
jgi:hypothetical protein